MTPMPRRYEDRSPGYRRASVKHSWGRADGLCVGYDDVTNPYDTCERGRCNHDLARAVGLAELWGDDGPYPAGVVLLRSSPSLFDDDQEPYVPDLAAEQQRWAV